METVEGTAEFTGIRASQVTGYDFGPMYFDNTKDVSFSDVVPFYQDGQLDEASCATTCLINPAARLH